MALQLPSKNISCHSSIALNSITPNNDCWKLVHSEPGEYTDPQIFLTQHHSWIPAIVPGTVAQSLQAAGQWDLDHCLEQQYDFDAFDWWYHGKFSVAKDLLEKKHQLRFDGLATVCEIWLNGKLLANTANMFRAYELDVSECLAAENDLLICFRSLKENLAQRRPRPSWKTNLTNHQQLRWIRTSLIGRMPGWTPPAAPVGPWLSIALERIESIEVSTLTLNTRLQQSTEGKNEGIVDIILRLTNDSDHPIEQASIIVGDQATPLSITVIDNITTLSAQATIPNVQLWWPHTHGVPKLYDCKLMLRRGDQTIGIDCGKLGFKHVELLTAENQFKLQINGSALFCRGACWSINNAVSLTGTEEELLHSLVLARDAGMNMIRIGGTMLYETDLFYQLCDRLGIMVWQDFMFANMDYPIGDEDFRTEIQAEVEYQINRLRQHPCLTVYCGGSEVEQQAAMLGMPQELWRNELFATVLPDYCNRLHPGIPYVTNSPFSPVSGTLPFHVGTGVAHYYGVGAYKRPLDDVKKANVQFTTECLAFSNIPEDASLEKAMRGLLPVAHHPRWKSRVPRDTGASWDFEDTRDHYLRVLFDVEPVTMRSHNMPEYLALSRVTPGEVMSRTFAEWRSAQMRCSGALIWLYKDFWPGAGWGIIDSDGMPKACYYYLKRAWATQVILITDEGLDGVKLHVINEDDISIDASVELTLLKNGKITIASATLPLTLEPGDNKEISADTMLGAFYDTTYSYRFGPVKHDLVLATLRNSKSGEVISEAFYFPVGYRLPKINACIEASAEIQDETHYLVKLKSDHFLQAVHFDVEGYLPSDNYFHLAPNQEKMILLTQQATAKKFRGYIAAINLHEIVKISVNS